MKIKKWKVFGLTIITWLVFSALAKAFVIAMQQRYPEYSMIDGQSVIWSWMSLLMGVFMAFRLREWHEVLWGILFFVICLFPFIGLVAGIGYFAWCYTKLEKRKLLITNAAPIVNLEKLELMEIDKTQINAKDIEHFVSEDDFIGLSIDLLIEAGSYICVIGNVMPANKRAWNSNQAVVGGQLVRLYKLISAMLDQTCQRRRETSFIFSRMAFECIINLRFLLKNYSEDLLLSYKSYSLKHEKKLMNKILDNIQNRNGETLPIETRMIDSILRSFKASGVQPEDIRAKELKNWGNKNIYERADDVGLGECYLAAFGGPSHNIHGNWQDLLEYHLEEIEEGYFEPDFEWNRPRPQYLNVIALHSIQALKEYISWLELEDASDITDNLDDYQDRVLLLDSLHEDWLSKKA